MVKARADEYRRYAAECLALAQSAQDLDSNDRARLVDMAHAFNELAARVESENKQTKK
jgi:hypothetical protein